MYLAAEHKVTMNMNTEYKFTCNRGSHYLEDSACAIGRDLQRVLPLTLVDEVLFHDCYWNACVMPELRGIRPSLRPSNINLFGITAHNITNNLGRPGKRTVVEIGLYFNTLDSGTKSRETADHSESVAAKIYWHKKKNVLKERDETLDPWNELAAMTFGNDVGLRFAHLLDFFAFREKPENVRDSEFAKCFMMEFATKKLEIELYRLAHRDLPPLYKDHLAAKEESYRYQAAKKAREEQKEGGSLEQQGDPAQETPHPDDVKMQKAEKRAKKIQDEIENLEALHDRYVQMGLESISLNNVRGTQNFERFREIRREIQKGIRTEEYKLPHERHYPLDQELPADFADRYYTPSYSGTILNAIRYWTLWWFREKVEGNTEQERIDWLKDFSLENPDLEARIAEATSDITGWLGDSSQFVFSHNDTTMRHAFVKTVEEDGVKKEVVAWYDHEKAGARRFGYDAVQLLNSRVTEHGPEEFLRYMGLFCRMAYNQSGGELRSLAGVPLFDKSAFDNAPHTDEELVQTQGDRILIHPGIGYHVKASLYMKINDSLHHIKNAVLGHIINQTDRQIFHYAPDDLDLGTIIFSKPMIEFYRRTLLDDLLFINGHHQDLGFTDIELKRLVDLMNILQCVTFSYDEDGVKKQHSPNLINTEIT